MTTKNERHEKTGGKGGELKQDQRKESSTRKSVSKDEVVRIDQLGKKTAKLLSTASPKTKNATKE